MAELVIVGLVSALASAATSALTAGESDAEGLEANRLPESKPLATSEGAPIYFSLGYRNRIPGSIIFVSDIDVDTITQSVGDGKGSSSVKTYEQRVDLLVSFGASVSARGKAEDIRKVWANSQLLYTSTDEDKGEHLWDEVQAIKAGSGQTVSSILSAHKNNAPAFKGSNHLAVKGLLISGDFGGSVPGKWEGLVAADPEDFTIMEALQALADFAGERSGGLFDSSKIDVSRVTGTRLTVNGIGDTIIDGQLYGYQWGGLKLASRIFADLMLAYDLSARDNGGVLEFLDRGAEDIVEVDAGDMGAFETSQDDSRPIRFTDEAGLRLPSSVTVRYLDPEAKWQRGGVTIRRNGAPYENPVSVDLEMTLTERMAKKVGRRRLWGPFLERKRAALKLPPKYAHVQETDILAVVYSGQRYYIRVIRLAVGDNFLIEVEGVVIYTQDPADDLLTSAADLYEDDDEEGDDEPPDVGDVDNEEDGIYAAPTMVTKLLDIPALFEKETQIPGFRFAHTTLSPSAKFLDALLYKSKDGVNYKPELGNTDNAISYAGLQRMGLTVDAIGDGYAAAVNSRFDRESTVTVDMYRTKDVLTSTDDAGLLFGTNLALIGSEIVQFKTVTQPDAATYPRRYTLSGFVRGLRNTEDHTTSHGIGETFILLSPVNVAPILVPKNLKFLGQVRSYKDVPASSTVAEVASTVVHVGYGETLRPFAPAWVRAARWSEFSSNPFATGGNALYDRFVSQSAVNPDDLLWIWEFRSRLPSWDLHDSWYDPPHDPNDGQELYRVRVYNSGGTLKDTIDLPAGQRWFFLSEADALSLYGITGGDAVRLDIRQRSILVDGDGTNSLAGEGNLASLTIPAA